MAVRPDQGERRLRVDPVRCDGFGHCAELAPELVRLDEWGYPIVSDQAVPARLVEEADLAIRTCPRRALFLQALSRRNLAPTRS
jgi:ferredoxin